MKQTYTPVGDLPKGTHFRASRDYQGTPEFVVIRQVEDFASVRRIDENFDSEPARLLQCNTMVWPLSDYARPPKD